MKRTIRTELVIETEEVTVTCIGLAGAPVHCPHCGGEVGGELFDGDSTRIAGPGSVAVEHASWDPEPGRAYDQTSSPTRRTRSA